MINYDDFKKVEMKAGTIVSAEIVEGADKLYKFMVDLGEDEPRQILSAVFGGVLGYFIGYSFFSLFGEQVIAFYGLEESFVKISEVFQDGAFLSIFVSAFTPIPYKVFTIAAGVFEVNFFTFMLASLVGRSARFFLVGLVMHVFGKKIGDAVYKRVNTISIIIGIVIVGIAVLILK
jgi:membrane protein DedA with SNARE-associated domain